MKFLLDQSADGRLGPYLSAQGHDVKRVGRDFPGGTPDREVLASARREDRILIAHDRDFGELVFNEYLPHAGVNLLRLGPGPQLSKLTARLDDLLAHHSHQLDRFVVVTDRLIRVR